MKIHYIIYGPSQVRGGGGGGVWVLLAIIRYYEIWRIECDDTCIYIVYIYTGRHCECPQVVPADRCCSCSLLFIMTVYIAQIRGPYCVIYKKKNISMCTSFTRQGTYIDRRLFWENSFLLNPAPRTTPLRNSSPTPQVQLRVTTVISIVVIYNCIYLP